MSRRQTADEAAFDALVAEQLAAIERGGAFDRLLGLDDFEWFGWVLGWLDKHRELGPLEPVHQATAVALLRYWLGSRREP